MHTIEVDAHKRVHEAAAPDDVGREVGRRRRVGRVAGGGQHPGIPPGDATERRPPPCPRVRPRPRSRTTA